MSQPTVNHSEVAMARFALTLLLLGLLTQLGCAHRRAAGHRPEIVKVLPHGHRPAQVNGRKYAPHNGTCYQPKGRGFVVVRGPLR
jgi:hypothetical protein